VGGWDQNASYRDWFGGCGLESTGSRQRLVAGCCECGDKPLGSCATELFIKRYLALISAYKNSSILISKLAVLFLSKYLFFVYLYLHSCCE
jgi:hypothetical protein